MRLLVRTHHHSSTPNSSMASPELHLNFLVFIVLIGFCAAGENQLYVNCSRGFSCGTDFQKIMYPFYGRDLPPDCGVSGLKLLCSPENLTTIDLAGKLFRVLHLHIVKNSMTITPTSFPNGDCLESFANGSWSFDPRSSSSPILTYSQDVEELCLRLYSCPSVNSPDSSYRFNCPSNGIDRTVHVVESSASVNNRCKCNGTIPVMKQEWKSASQRMENKSAMFTILSEVVKKGFEVQYQINESTACDVCKRHHGLCWSKTNSRLNPTCLCPNGPSDDCKAGGDVDLKRKIGIGVGAAAFTAIVMGIIFYFYHGHYRKRNAILSLASHVSSSHIGLTQELEKMGIHLFAYHELAEATNHFDPQRELGDGGYGTVYKGKLQDGRTVAVKRLYEYHYKRVEQFMNEVVLLTRLKHQNLVSLYGCTSDNVKELLLVYEYIPNGTLADHLYGSRATAGSPSWITRMNIAIDTASALAYLHASEVIHRDIKSTNILIDQNFTVKVADFGISRVRPTDATHISTAPQGTPGYVDPEYTEFYQLTEKSDVYSFGVVLMELISSKPAVDITRDRNEINLSAMAVKKIQRNALHELVDPSLGFESDYQVQRMMVAVAELGFQCLQMGRDMRPDMQDVLDSLEEILNREYGRDDSNIPADDAVMLKRPTLPHPPKRICTRTKRSKKRISSSAQDFEKEDTRGQVLENGARDVSADVKLDLFRSSTKKRLRKRKGPPDYWVSQFLSRKQKALASSLPRK